MTSNTYTDGVEATQRYKVVLIYGERSWTVEEETYAETKKWLERRILSLLGSALRFDLERIIKDDRGIRGNFSVELAKSRAEKVRTARFAVNTCLPKECLSHDSLVLKLEVRE